MQTLPPMLRTISNIYFQSVNIFHYIIKKLFIEGIEEEIENRSLKLKFQMIQKDGSVKNTNQLVPISLTKSKYIYFYENVDSKSFLKNF